MNDCAVVIAPYWGKGGANNVFAAQCAYYHSKNWAVLLLLVPELRRRRDFNAPFHSELRADCVAQSRVGDLTKQVRYFISKKLLRNHSDGVLHRNFMTRVGGPDREASEFLRGKTIREICVNWCDNVDLAIKLRQTFGPPAAPIVLHTHDVVADHAWPEPERSQEIGKRELQWVGEADRLVHVSELDAQHFAASLGKPQKPQIVSYLTLDPRLERRLGEFSHRPKAGTILYVGSWNLANPPSIAWFFKQVLPFVDRSANIVVAGGICEYIRRGLGDHYARSDNIHLLDQVDDVAEFYERAAVVILPTTVGTGASVKLVEALAMGVPTVMSSLALRGLPLALKETLRPFTADRPIEFAEKLNGVLAGEVPSVDLRQLYWDHFSNAAWFRRLDAGESDAGALAQGG